VIYGKLTVHDRQIYEVHVEITRKGLAHARFNNGKLDPPPYGLLTHTITRTYK